MKVPTISFVDGLLVTLVLAVLVALAWNFDPFGRRQAAEVRAGAAEVQADISTAAAGVAGSTAVQTLSINRRAEEAQDALDASTDPDDDLAAWSAGIDRVRDAGGAADHSGPR
ncbi:hypothetical protein SGCZBJ_03910 [Caulobacter zeae]|uniref:Uncharacterized protein n=1 Tax=Caulobacter zeae TaxID=2055137 RepID=A0A2N5DQ25_9CAUL|nr:hypothetical protein [Caulobacter zeae]PLR28163.1 hypothetical protein SGCZBJ_03910 [Caulobacter zeae]